jgi:hypothetical protein
LRTGGVIILILALGGLATAFFLLMSRHSILLAVQNLTASADIAFTGIVALYNLDWQLINLTFPFILILVGIWLIVGFGARKDQNQ